MKDHPEKTAKHIADSLHEPADVISRQLYELKTRGMVKQTKGRLKKFEWTAICRVGETFELKPKRKTVAGSSVQSPATATAGLPKPVPEDVLEYNFSEKPLSGKAFTAEEKADKMLSEIDLKLAHALFQKLKTYFVL